MLTIARLGRTVVVATVLLYPAAAIAKQAPAPPPAPPPIVSGTAEVSFVAASGNSSTQSVGLAGNLVYRPDSWVLDTKVSFVRSEANRVVSAKSFALASRLSRDLSARLALFGQYDYQRDLFAGIIQRHAVTAGISYKAIEACRHRLRLDGGAGYAHEQRVAGPTLSTATVLAGVLYHLKISDTSEFSEDARLVASLSAAPDRRVDETTALTAKMTAGLSLKVSYVVHFVNAPPPGFRKTDTIAAASLLAKF